MIDSKTQSACHLCHEECCPARRGRFKEGGGDSATGDSPSGASLGGAERCKGEGRLILIKFYEDHQREKIIIFVKKNYHNDFLIVNCSIKISIEDYKIG